MSENDSPPQNPNEQPAELDSSNTPPSQDAEAEQAAPAVPQVYTEADGVPDWAVGKTAKDVISLTGSLMETMKTFDPATQQQPAAPTQPAYVAPVAAPIDPQQQLAPIMPAADLAYNDPAAYNTQMASYMDARDASLRADLTQQFQTVMQPINATMGSMARQQIANDPEYIEVFSKWGHEVDQEFARNGVTPNQRTPQAYRLVGDIIRGRHVTDLARVEAERMLASGGNVPTVRAGTGGELVLSAPPGDAFDQAWDEGEIGIIQAAKYNNVTKEDMRKSIKHTGHTVDEWVKLMSGDNVFVATDGRLTRTQTLAPSKRGNN